MPDITPPNYSTAIGQVRLLIPDTDQLDNLADPSAAAEYIFNDAQVQAFLSMNKDNVKRAAAQAKLTLATSEALINKVIRSYDFATDGAKLGAELRAQADQLQKDADRDELYDSYDIFTIVTPMIKDDGDWL